MERTDILIRRAQPDETGCLARIGLDAWLKGIAPLVPESVRREIVGDNPFLPFLRTQGSAIFVGEIAGEPAGIGACENTDDTISDIWVAPAFEGHGVGSAIVRALEGEIRSRGYEFARIQVAALNARAFGLYLHLGYTEDWRAVRFDPVLKVALEKVELSRSL